MREKLLVEVWYYCPDRVRLHDSIVDQLPMLSHLKKWLAQVSISRPPPAKPTLIMELIPQVGRTHSKLYHFSLHSFKDKRLNRQDVR